MVIHLGKLNIFHQSEKAKTNLHVSAPPGSTWNARISIMFVGDFSQDIPHEFLGEITMFVGDFSPVFMGFIYG